MNKNMCYRKKLESLHVKILTMVISVLQDILHLPICISRIFSKKTVLFVLKKKKKRSNGWRENGLSLDVCIEKWRFLAPINFT